MKTGLYLSISDSMCDGYGLYLCKNEINTSYFCIKYLSDETSNVLVSKNMHARTKREKYFHNWLEAVHLSLMYFGGKSVLFAKL